MESQQVPFDLIVQLNISGGDGDSNRTSKFSGEFERKELPFLAGRGEELDDMRVSILEFLDDVEPVLLLFR